MARLANYWDNFNFKRVLTNALIILCLLLLWSNCEKGAKISQINGLNSSLSDTATFWKTKEGFHKARITVLEANTARDFINLSTKDTTIIKLQKLVNNNKQFIKKQGSITVIESETKIKTSVANIVDNNTKVYPDGKSPIYTSQIKLGKWVTGSTIATRDSTIIDISFREEMDFVIGRKKTGFLGLGKGQPFVEATLHNPYSEIKVIRSYQPKAPANKKYHIGPTLVYGIGQNLQPGVYIGIGFTWGIINF
jgi:hypothetical protein